jgi:hypothetical protein
MCDECKPRPETARDLHALYVGTFLHCARMSESELRDAFHLWGGFNYARDGKAFLGFLWNDDDPCMTIGDVERLIVMPRHLRRALGVGR